MLLGLHRYDKLTIGTDHVTYTTPRSKVNAAFACLLDTSRTPVLKALLALRKESILQYRVPAYTLARLGTPPEVFNNQEDNDHLGQPCLRMASLYLGNLDAFKLLDSGLPQHEESLLHLAAFLALPKFIKTFLKTYDPNAESEEYDNYIPLAVAIQSTTPVSWCKIANAEAPFAERRLESIRLLAHRTPEPLKWRFRQKTVFHLALEQGVDTTTTLLEALNISQDPERFEKLAYTDKAGRSYSPEEYVTELMDLDDDAEREKLKGCLPKQICWPQV